MILYLTDSLRIRENDTPEYRKLLMHSIRNIAVAATENSHGLFGDYDILADCVTMFQGDEELYGLFRYLVDNWFSSPVPICVSYYIEVVRENPSEKNDGKRIIAQRTIGEFHDQSSVAPCQLVCEDDTDCTFYNLMINHYIAGEKIKAHVKYQNDACGGCGHAHDKVINHLRLNQICLCILDSDRCYPEKAINKEAKQCMSIDNHRCGYRCVVLDVHEIENLLPLNYVIPAVEQCPDYAKYQSVRDQVQHFKYLMGSSLSPNILPYYDFKDGVKNIPEVTGNVDHMRFAEMCWSEDPDLSAGISFTDYISSRKKGECICYRLSRTVLEDTLKYIGRQKELNTLPAPNLKTFQVEEWNRIGQNLLNWGYSSSIEAVS